ncbi:uncharacterized protein LOC143525446 isoform X2 [Brachyhypopomus gauderio]|uniref:uncharacterized protein LOC143525446 isoform X2 n=1 Tax=Brachyhypopomus gauderio TaxID=698409 RepID=UPI004042C185
MWIIPSLNLYLFILHFSVLFTHVFVNDVRPSAGHVETVQVTEGDTVILQFHFTGVENNEVIWWAFGPKESRIAQLVNYVPSFDKQELFRNRLQLDKQSGYLTIRNISVTHTGVYKVSLLSNEVLTKQFSVIVYATLPVPYITRSSHTETKSSETLTCLVLCSVGRTTSTTLSWYKGDQVISTLSDSNSSTPLLPLEVGYDDNNTYSCVAANPVSNQTAQFNRTSVCPPVSGYLLILFIIITVILLLLVVILLLYWKFTKAKHIQMQEEEIHYADTVFCAQSAQTVVRVCVCSLW